METVSMGEAARLTGRTKGTLSKAIANGRLPYVEKVGNGYLIDVSELERVFPARTPQPPARSSSNNRVGADSDVEIASLRSEIDLLREHLADVRADRDAWRAIANRLADAPSRPKQ